MSTQISPSPTIKLNLPPGIMANAEIESKRIGISLQDFIRMLMATYFAHSPSIRAISNDQALYNRAQQEIQAGQFTTVTNKRQLNKYFASLDG